MAGVTSLPVRVKFWRGARLSGPTIMVCTNVLVSQSKHSKSCYLVSFSHLLSNSAPFFPMVQAKWSCQEKKGSSLKSKSGKWDWEEGRERGWKVVKEERDGKTDACKLTNINRQGPQVCPLNHVWNAGKHTTYWSPSCHLLLFGAVSEKNKKKEKQMNRWDKRMLPPSKMCKEQGALLPPLQQSQLV